MLVVRVGTKWLTLLMDDTIGTNLKDDTIGTNFEDDTRRSMDDTVDLLS